LIKYFSFKKLINLLLNSWEYKQKKISISSIPSIVHFDVSNICILNCPLCPTGKKDKSQSKATMTFENFKRVFDQVKDYLFFVWLYNWGEPFICKDIFKIVDYCHQNNVGVRLHSNLNYYNEEILEKIVKSKIDYISLSIDGFSQENYQFYRRKGNLKKVLAGIEKIQALKRRYKNKFPILIWQYLINNRNLGEVEKARSLAEKYKIDVFEARPLFLFTEVDSRFKKTEYDQFLSQTGVPENSARSITSSSHCRFLWCSLAINPNLSFAPCPIIYRDSDVFGQFSRKRPNFNLKEEINSPIFQESRKLFSLKGYQSRVFTPCRRCTWFTKPC